MARDAKADLLSDLAEVSDGLVEWAQDQFDAGYTAEEIIAKLKEAARLSGRA